MKIWLCLICRKELKDDCPIEDILIDMFTGKAGPGGAKLSPTGLPICPQCGNVCAQVDDGKEDN